MPCQWLELPEDIVDVDGGSIAHRHAIGATGTTLPARLLQLMTQDGGARYS
ncbi:hypothetical protein N5C66_25500 [Rhizobium pusense]|nr:MULTISPECIES: hypothetical protein [Agrobacterium]MDH0912400.1 hypothetical protein [Agrobacterium pusense]MDH1098531.1 hypothetical protein [Agrobacterium pusense]MDH1115069.1 hypothetical protein [Agrobacterium pusense]MDH2196849.1 hypothetical protein [Agrobacterium pusense]